MTLAVYLWDCEKFFFFSTNFSEGRNYTWIPDSQSQKKDFLDQIQSTQYCKMITFRLVMLHLLLKKIHGIPVYVWSKIGVFWEGKIYLKTWLLAYLQIDIDLEFQMRYYTSFLFKGTWICYLSNFKTLRNWKSRILFVFW